MQEEREEQDADKLQALVGSAPPAGKKLKPAGKAKSTRQPKEAQVADPPAAAPAAEDHTRVWGTWDGVDYTWAAGPKDESERGEVKVDTSLLKKGSIVWYASSHAHALARTTRLLWHHTTILVHYTDSNPNHGDGNPNPFHSLYPLAMLEFDVGTQPWLKT